MKYGLNNNTGTIARLANSNTDITKITSAGENATRIAKKIQAIAKMANLITKK